MRILYIDVNYKNSSTGDIVYNLHKQCEKNNIESAICYGRGAKIKEINIYKFGIDIETYLHAFLTRITGYTGCYSYFSTKKLIKYIKKFNPDIVHIHELHAYFVNIKQLLLYLKKNDIPTVFTNHCEFLYTGKCGYAKSCGKYSKECGNCPLLREYPSSLFFDHTKHMLKVKKEIFSDWENIYIANPSNWLQGKIGTSFLKNKKNVVIHNGIDTDTFKFVGKNTDEKIVLAIANHILTKFKGGYQILEIAKQLEKENIKFILVGADEPFPQVPANVEIHGYVTDKEELAKLYSNADCFLMLSEYENFPTTCIEAQCCGTKVIANNAGGIKETLINGCGVAINYSDSASIIREINRILINKYNKEEISKKASEHYAFDRMFSEYMILYKKCGK